MFTLVLLNIVSNVYFLEDGTITRHEYTNLISSQAPDLLSYAHALYDIYDANGDHHLGMQDLDALYSLMDSDGNTIECLCKNKANTSNSFTI